MVKQHETDIEVFSFKSPRGIIVCYVHDALVNAVYCFDKGIPCCSVKVMYCNVTTGKCCADKVIFNVNDIHDNVRVFNPTTLVTNLEIACPYEML